MGERGHENLQGVFFTFEHPDLPDEMKPKTGKGEEIEDDQVAVQAFMKLAKTCG